MTAHVIHSARLVSDGHVVHNAWVRFDGGTIAATGTGDDWRSAVVSDDTVSVTDADGAWLTPGFVDIHGHGGATASYDDGPERIRRALDLHQRHGTTRAVVSLVTAPVDRLAESVREIAALSREDSRVLGSHLEGPFLDVGHKGAHEPSLLRSATPEDIDLLLAAADGTLRQITIAPELPGGLDAVRALSAAGVAVAVGHTAADYAQTMEAFAAGASILTHAYNGMDGVHHRAPGPVAAATRTAGVTLEIINDGVHVHRRSSGCCSPRLRVASRSSPTRWPPLARRTATICSARSPCRSGTASHVSPRAAPSPVRR